MQLAWLQRLLADRGIEARFIRDIRLTADTENRMWLDVELDATNERGKSFPVWDGNGMSVAREHHMVPVAGIVFDPKESA